MTIDEMFISEKHNRCMTCVNAFRRHELMSIDDVEGKISVSIICMILGDKMSRPVSECTLHEVDSGVDLLGGTE